MRFKCHGMGVIVSRLGGDNQDVVQLDMPCLKAFEGVSQAGHYADGTSRGEGGVAPPGYARARFQCSPVTSSISSYTLGEIATGIDLLRSRNSGSPITVAIAA